MADRGPRGILTWGRGGVERMPTGSTAMKECVTKISSDSLKDPTGSDTPCLGERHHRGAIPKRGTAQEEASL